MGGLVVVLVVALLGLCIAAAADQVGRRAVDDELASLTALGLAELLAARLASGPLPILVSSGHRWYGPFLDLDLAPSRLRVRLYQSPGLAGLKRHRAVLLRSLTYRQSGGWQLVMEGPDQAECHLGWLVESL